jgi:hypothetical protein
VEKCKPISVAPAPFLGPMDCYVLVEHLTIPEEKQANPFKAEDEQTLVNQLQQLGLYEEDKVEEDLIEEDEEEEDGHGELPDNAILEYELLSKLSKQLDRKSSFCK